MGILSNALTVASLVAGLQREPGMEVDGDESCGALSAKKLLNPYLYDNIFLPIITKGTIPVARLDFSRVTSDDIKLIESVLEADDSASYIGITEKIVKLRPSVSNLRTFI